MVDRVYKTDLPRLRKSLIILKEEFTNLGTNTDWTRIRIEPLLKHIESLEQVLNSPEFSPESSRLRCGVKMFHSDLVYLLENVKELKDILQSEKKRHP
jgi:hypothetical protein